MNESITFCDERIDDIEALGFSPDLFTTRRLRHRQPFRSTRPGRECAAVGFGHRGRYRQGGGVSRCSNLSRQDREGQGTGREGDGDLLGLQGRRSEGTNGPGPQPGGGGRSLLGAGNPQGRLSADTLFAFNKATLTPQGEAALDKFLQDLRGASVSSMQVIGHTDPLGSDAYNMQLSEKRANRVARYLVSRGVPADRIRAEGRGETELKVTPEECAAQGAKTRPALIQCYQPNRRVDVTVSGAAPAAM